MAVHLFIADEDLIDNVSDDPRVPEDMREAVAKRAAELAEKELSGEFMSAFYAETERLVGEAMEQLGVEPLRPRPGGWPDWVDESDFGAYVREAGGGAVEVALYEDWSDGEVCLYLVPLDSEAVEYRLSCLRSGKYSGIGDDLLADYDSTVYGTSDAPERVAEMRALVEDVLSWQTEAAWLAARTEG